ncbi:alpha/beta hydrolase [Chryseobacterium phosphatilyticum]|uniref:Alpha/beta hydrolase n=1 Tax=Chryseobacterium phosphatilyticum TaxID=475075 RepID=A0A316XCR1_9FLAO|nr:alpha/beta hydrolase [Chryseobacterium phosphatilyticum]PWN70023.1 alpha/beta hydrolase [Chryseobacterium phosphatilyticum]
MEKYTPSSDGQKIHYKESGKGKTTLIFVHGWLGNTEWWNHQQEYFKNDYHIIQMDLAGHGKSDSGRQNWASELYADDIKAVTDTIDASDIILIGHSMSGAYVLEAALKIPKTKAIVIIDTLKDLDESFTEEQAEQLMFSHYRNDFKYAVENFLPQYLFAAQTPPAVKERLQHEFLQNEPEMVINLLKPLYQTDYREIAKDVQVPVVAINSDASPTNTEANRKYLKHYDNLMIEGVGHYPMLEKPDEFNTILDKVLKKLS